MENFLSLNTCFVPDAGHLLESQWAARGKQEWPCTVQHRGASPASLPLQTRISQTCQQVSGRARVRAQAQDDKARCPIHVLRPPAIGQDHRLWPNASYLSCHHLGTACLHCYLPCRVVRSSSLDKAHFRHFILRSSAKYATRGNRYAHPASRKGLSHSLFGFVQ